jgi:hypothetical protein
MAIPIEVRVAGLGSMIGPEIKADPAASALCGLCGQSAEVVVSVSTSPEAFACPPCLRERLDAVSVARFRLRDAAAGGIPWGKVSGLGFSGDSSVGVSGCGWWCEAA